MPRPDFEPPVGPEEPVRVAVIGAGWMGVAHLRAYAARPDVRIVGLVTRSPDRAAELRARFPIEATFDDVTTMLDAARPHGVSVTTGEHDHVEPACLALDRGVGALVEKPLASSVEGAERIAMTAESSGAVLVPAHVLRFAAPHRALREQIVAGRIGEILAITARRDRSRAIAAAYDRVHPAYLTSVHDIDQVVWLSRSRVVRVRALEVRRTERAQPDAVWAQLELASGAIASVATAMLHPAGDGVTTSDRLEVYGSDGVAALDLGEPVVAFHAATPVAVDWILEPEDGGGAFGAEIAHFCACLRSGGPSGVITPDEALHGIRVADAMVRSAARGEVVAVP